MQAAPRGAGVTCGAQHPLDPLSPSGTTSNGGGEEQTPPPSLPPLSRATLQRQNMHAHVCKYVHVQKRTCMQACARVQICTPAPRGSAALPCSSWPPSYPTSWQSGPAPQRAPCRRLAACRASAAGGAKPSGQRAELGAASMGVRRGWEGSRAQSGGRGGKEQRGGGKKGGKEREGKGEKAERRWGCPGQL